MTQSDRKKSAPLLAEFPVPTLAQWEEEVERLLKGRPFAKAMFSHTLEGIIQGPMPTAADVGEVPWLDTLPGQAPFVRGAHPVGGAPNRWLVAQEIRLPSPEEFNAALRHDLARGQTAVNLVLDPSGQNGTAIVDVQGLKTALAKVDLQDTPVMIEAGEFSLPAAATLVGLWKKSAVDLKQVTGFLGCDPIYGLALEGQLPVPLKSLFDQLAALTRWASCAPKLRTLPVHETLWHEGGADHALSLALTLSGAIHVLREMEGRGLDPAEAAARIHFHAAVDTDFFTSLAKIRALRLVWSKIQFAAGLEPVPAFIHARTSRRMLAVLEPYPNLLRTTTAAMAAIMGGADSLHTSCYDEAVGAPDEFSRRIARNVQLILAHEVHLDHVTDPVGGAWHPEKLTADLAAAAWKHVQFIESAGGIVKALQSGIVQQKIAGVAAARRQRLATGKNAMVGVNRFADPEVRLPSPRPVRASGLDTGNKDCDVLDLAWENDFAQLIDAVAAGARLDSLVPSRPEDLTVEAIVPQPDAAPFEDIRRRVQASGERPATRVLCACLGDPARYMPRLDFVRGFFQSGGFKVISEGFSLAPAEVVKAAEAAQTATVVLVGLDETYGELAVEVANILAAMDPPPRVLLAGKPGPLEDELRRAQVTEFLHARSDMLEVLGRLAADPEVAP